MTPLSPRRKRTRLAGVALIVTLLASGPSAAMAKKQQSLPDPDGGKSKQTASRNSTAKGADLPHTGSSPLPLVAGGLALLAAGVAVRPIQRRRRGYSTDVWDYAVRTHLR